MSALFPFLIWLSIIVAVLGGWFMNIVKLFGMSWDVVTGGLVVRLVGVPVPIIGALAGWF